MSADRRYKLRPDVSALFAGFVAATAIAVAIGVLAFVTLAPSRAHGEDDGQSGGLTSFMIQHPSGDIYEAISTVSDYLQLHEGARVNVKVLDRPEERTLDLYLVRFVHNEEMMRGEECAGTSIRRDQRACTGQSIGGYWQTSLRDPLH